MKLSKRSKISAVATITALIGRTQAVGDCDLGGPWNSHAVGYETGGEWCASKWTIGAAINGIQGWANGDSVNGLEFQWTNGEAPQQVGKMTGDKKEWLSWDTTKETVESITVWPNGRSDVQRVAAIEIKISGRDPWKIGTTPPNTQGYDSPVVQGAGIIMGAYGRHGGSVDMLGFLMLDSGIKNRNVKDFALNGDSVNGNNEALKNQKPEAVDSFSQENWTGGNMTYQVDRTIEKERSWSTTRSSSKTFGGSVGASVDFGLPAIGLGGSVTTEFHWETTDSWEKSDSGTDKTQLFFSVSGSIPKREAIYCEALAFSGKYDLDYDNTIELELQSGRTWSYKESGTVKGVAWSKNENKCVSYKEGENGAEVLEKKLAEWKANPEKEEQENKEREERAEEDLKGPEPTSSAEASASATESATPSKTKSATPTKTEDSEPTSTDEPTDEEEDQEPTDEEEDQEPTDEDGDEEPTDEEGDEEPTDEEGDEEPTSEEGDEEPTSEEGDEEPTSEEGDEEPTSEEGDEEPTSEEGDEEPTSEEGDEEPTSEEGDEELTSEEGDEEPTDEEETQEPTNEEEDEQPTETSVASSAATAEATLDATLDLGGAGAGAGSTPDRTSKAHATTTARARTSSRHHAARAEVTPAPASAVEGKRSLFFSA